MGATSGFFSLGLTSSFFSDGVLSLDTGFLTEGTFSFSFFFSGGVFSTSGLFSEAALCLLCLGESPFFFFSAETQRQVSNTKRLDQHKITLRRISVLACVVSASVQFRSKERGTTVKDRVKKGGSRPILRVAKTENPVARRSLVFLCNIY